MILLGSLFRSIGQSQEPVPDLDSGRTIYYLSQSILDGPVWPILNLHPGVLSIDLKHQILTYTQGCCGCPALATLQLVHTGQPAVHARRPGMNHMILTDYGVLELCISNNLPAIRPPRDR